jgi:hypothetical protein
MWDVGLISASTKKQLLQGKYDPASKGEIAQFYLMNCIIQVFPDE